MSLFPTFSTHSSCNLHACFFFHFKMMLYDFLAISIWNVFVKLLSGMLFFQMVDLYSMFPQIRNHFFGYSLLFYSLFYVKIGICFLYKGVSYLREPAVSHLVDRYTYPSPQCFINYLMWNTSRRSPLKESVESLILFRSHPSKLFSTVGSISFKCFSC